MTPLEIFRQLWDGGIALGLSDNGQNLTYQPAAKLTPEQRALLLAHKPALLEYLHQARSTTAALIEAAMARCFYWGDNEAARQAMLDDCQATPVHLQAELLDYFKRVAKA